MTNLLNELEIENRRRCEELSKLLEALEEYDDSMLTSMVVEYVYHYDNNNTKQVLGLEEDYSGIGWIG